MFNWMKAKWAALSRLPADGNERYLPFTDPTHTATNSVSPIQQQSQEWKMLRRNELHKPSDTDAIASKDSCDEPIKPWDGC